MDPRDKTWVLRTGSKPSPAERDLRPLVAVVEYQKIQNIAWELPKMTQQGYFLQPLGGEELSKIH